MQALTEWEQHPDNETVAQVAARFDLPEQWAGTHVGAHRCVDGKHYTYSCLVSDPSCDAVARGYMELRAVAVVA